MRAPPLSVCKSRCKDDNGALLSGSLSQRCKVWPALSRMSTASFEEDHDDLVVRFKSAGRFCCSSAVARPVRGCPGAAATAANQPIDVGSAFIEQIMQRADSLRLRGDFLAGSRSPSMLISACGTFALREKPLVDRQTVFFDGAVKIEQGSHNTSTGSRSARCAPSPSVVNSSSSALSS